MVGLLGRHKGELGHAIPRAKKAAAFLRISTSSSSRLTSRRSRWVSACSALRAANASAEQGEAPSPPSPKPCWVHDSEPPNLSHATIPGRHQDRDNQKVLDLY